MLKEKLPFVLINTLLLHIPLLVLTDRQTDRQRNEYTCCAWAGGTFFQLCCCVNFLVLARNRCWCYLRTYTCSTWAGGTESQFVVEGKFIRDSHNTCSKSILELQIYEFFYVLTCIMFSSIVKRALINKLLFRIILFSKRWSIKTLNASVCCVISFPFQHGLLPLPTPPLSAPNINVILVANTAAIIAATAKLPPLLRVLLLL